VRAIDVTPSRIKGTIRRIAAARARHALSAMYEGLQPSSKIHCAGSVTSGVLPLIMAKSAYTDIHSWPSLIRRRAFQEFQRWTCCLPSKICFAGQGVGSEKNRWTVKWLRPPLSC
jgi:hypothetical protein